MSDAPSGSAGQEEPGAYAPSGLRRSTFTPPPPGAPLPTFDDDALAAAMEAEVRTYTTPITLPVLPSADEAPVVEPPRGPEPSVHAPEPPTAPPEPVSAPAAQEPASAPAAHEPVASVPVVPVPVASWAPAPVPVAPDPDPLVTPVEDDGPLRDPQRASTVDATQGREQELDRRATGPATIIPPTPAFFSGAPPISPAAPGPDPADAETVDRDPVVDPEPEAPESPTPVGRPEAAIELPPAAAVEDPAPSSADIAFSDVRSEPPAPLLPPPSDLPDIARRAELPPPPGYTEDGSLEHADPVESAGPTSAEDWDHLLATAPPPRVEALADPPPAPPVVPPAALPSSLAVDEDDDVDEGDRVPDATESVALSAFAPPVSTPSAATPSPADGIEPEPHLPPALAIETAGIGPTRRELRAGRAARLFWLWFAANASVVSVALGAVMLGTGMSLRQAIVATVIGIALSFIPLGFGTLAGKWSSQPTMIVSRAGFGLAGNALPAVLAIVVRVFWGGVLLWLLADSVGRVLVGAHADGGLGATPWALIGLGVGVVLTALVAVLGYGLLARVQLVLSIVAALVVVGTAVVAISRVRLDTALTLQDGPWYLVAGGAVLVFSFVGLVWANSGSDLARYQRPGGSGARSMLWATFGATIPPLLLIVGGALLAASSPALATGLATDPISTIAGLLPGWYPAPLLIAAAAGLLSGSALSLYSGGFAVQALAPRIRRPVGVLITAVLALAVGVGLVLLDVDTRTVVRDLAVTLAVPVAAWVGIFAAEMMIRQRRFHTPSLLAPGGVYPTVRWVNVVGLVIIAVIGYGFVASAQSWLAWQGFGWRLFGVDSTDPLATIDLGVLGALLLGILLPLATAIPTIRRQESAVAGATPPRT
jgi:purine-cytosine permease-like protein